MASLVALAYPSHCLIIYRLLVEIQARFLTYLFYEKETVNDGVAKRRIEFEAAGRAGAGSVRTVNDCRSNY